MNTPSSEKQRVGIFTGGGIAPGLNAVISSATRQLQAGGHDVIGIPDGWQGLLEARPDTWNLSGMSRRRLRSLMQEGGTILGSSRTKIKPDKYGQVADTVRAYGLTGLIAIGGDDTLGQARELQEAGVISANGVPKTIDNDLDGTSLTFGFESAVEEVAEELRRMRTDASSSRRVAVVQVMGRNAGWLTMYGGEAGGADLTLIPEFQIDEDRLLAEIERIYKEPDDRGFPARNVVVAISEGYYGEDPKAEKDPFGHAKLGGAAARLKKLVESRLVGVKAQEQVIEYHARNGEPLAHDSVFAGKLGAHAGALASAGQYGRMVSLRAGEVTDVSLSEARGGRFVTDDLYDPETMTMRLVPKNVMDRILATRRNVNGVRVS